MVSNSPSSLVRSRRRLHEALLQLEREGAAIVDRSLHSADLALSTDACCCIWTEDRLKVDPQNQH